MSKSIESAVSSQASRNYTLAATLDKISEAPGLLQACNKRIEEGKQNTDKFLGQTRTFELKRRQLLRTHNGYRESRFKRFFHRATGNTDKFNMKAAKAEEEYVEAVTQLKTAEDNLSEAKRNLEMDTSKLPELQNTAAHYDNTARELDSLLDSIFAGPTPGYEHEDAVEAKCNEALRNIQDAEQAYSREMLAHNNIKSSQGVLANAIQCARQALTSAGMDMLGSYSANALKRSSLQSAEVMANQAVIFLNTAKQTSPSVEVPKMFVAPKGGLFMDVYFDNIISDYSYYKKATKSKEDLDEMTAKVNEEMRKCLIRLSNIRSDIAAKQSVHDKIRGELFVVRQDIIKQIVPPTEVKC